jgi:hypothetical protein
MKLTTYQDRKKNVHLMRCACGNQAVSYHGSSGAVCQRCLDIEMRMYGTGRKKVGMKQRYATWEPPHEQWGNA